MAGVNLALKENKKLFESAQDNFFSSTVEKHCIFISYQRKDEAFAEAVANYIMKVDLNVYFDLNDGELLKAKDQNNPDKVNKCILNGLSVSQNILVLLSNTTMSSVWVPFEIGYGYAREKNISILKHRETVDVEMPTYLRTIDTIGSLDMLAEYLLSKSKVPIPMFTKLNSYILFYGEDPIEQFLKI